MNYNDKIKLITTNSTYGMLNYIDTTNGINDNLSTTINNIPISTILKDDNVNDTNIINNNINYNNIINKKIDIKDIEILVPNKVVKVIFNDDTFEKAICMDCDVFNLKDAVTVCLAKKICGGSSRYHNLLEKVLKIMKRNVKK